MNLGVLSGIAACLLWGLMPIYFKLLDHVSSGEILGHRVVWSLFFVALLLVVRKQWQWLSETRKSPSLLVAALYSALLLGVNWLTYIWAVTSGFILEASLGYYISPLLSVLLGMLFLGERLRLGQWAAVIIAAIGVLYITVIYQSLPWIAMVLAGTFGFYGLSKKRSPLGSVEGLFIETLVAVPIAFVYLFYLHSQDLAQFAQGSLGSDLLLVGVGLATALPLLLFTFSAKMISMSLLGFLQYIGPTVQLLVGIYWFNELFTGPRVVGFSLIWLALIIYSLDGFYHLRKPKTVIAQ